MVIALRKIGPWQISVASDQKFIGLSHMVFRINNEDEMEARIYNCLCLSESSLQVNGLPLSATFLLADNIINWSVYKVDHTGDGISKLVSTTTFANIKSKSFPFNILVD